MHETPYILVLYYSTTGSTKEMAEQISAGIEGCYNISAKIRTVPSSYNDTKNNCRLGVSFCSEKDLAECSGLILGSPTRFGNPSASLQSFIESTSAIWLSGRLVGKPAAVFTSSASLHGGQESTLLSMMLPLLHHGMLICGIPYTESVLHRTKSGGTPYGASHVSGKTNETQLTDHEKILCKALGKRVANIALKLISN